MQAQMFEIMKGRKSVVTNPFFLFTEFELNRSRPLIPSLILLNPCI